MTFEIEIDGRSRTVSVERTSAGHFHVTLERQPHGVDAVRIGRFGLSLLLDGGASRELYVVPGTARGETLVTLEGRTVAVALNGRRSGSGLEGGSAATGEITIAAPMPGRVVRVLVTPGDEVQARQPVIVVEAMKMENELRSPKAGRVKDVAVAAGTSVEAGRALIVIE